MFFHLEKMSQKELNFGIRDLAFLEYYILKSIPRLMFNIYYIYRKAKMDEVYIYIYKVKNKVIVLLSGTKFFPSCRFEN